MPRAGTGHTNLSTLLGLNAGAAQDMRNRVQGTVDGEIYKAQTGLSDAYAKWDAQATHGGAGWEEWLSQNGGGEVEQGLQSAQRARDYQGTLPGRQALLQKTYNGGGNALDAMLMGGNVNQQRGGAPIAGGLQQARDAAATRTAGLKSAASAQGQASYAEKQRQREERMGRAQAAPTNARRENIGRRSGNPYEP